ncbi:hypothetical protein JYU15_02150 [bacterium AH-315-I18]|nr:hypothetical protein [Phycisphaeraceae bacterium]MBN4061218.1 hypothetical protein [bacterium AH-315-I18]
MNPPLEPTVWRNEAFYFNTGSKKLWSSPDVFVRVERFTGGVDDVSLRECEIALVVDVKTAGRQKYFLYYALLEGISQSPPSHVATSLPTQLLISAKTGPTEFLNTDTTYRLDAGKTNVDLWYATPTQRVLPRASPQYHPQSVLPSPVLATKVKPSNLYSEHVRL